MVSSEAIAAAQAAEQKWKIPASVALAQYGLESGWGTHVPVGSNNPFGIKAGPQDLFVLSMTTEFVHGRYVRVEQKFAKYSSLQDAFDAHARLLALGIHYIHAREFLPNVAAFVGALTGVYATDPQYGVKLLKLIQEDNLEQYDGTLL